MIHTVTLTCAHAGIGASMFKKKIKLYIIIFYHLDIPNDFSIILFRFEKRFIPWRVLLNLK